MELPKFLISPVEIPAALVPPTQTQTRQDSPTREPLDGVAFTGFAVRKESNSLPKSIIISGDLLCTTITARRVCSTSNIVYI